MLVPLYGASCVQGTFAAGSGDDLTLVSGAGSAWGQSFSGTVNHNIACTGSKCNIDLTSFGVPLTMEFYLVTDASTYLILYPYNNLVNIPIDPTWP